MSARQVAHIIKDRHPQKTDVFGRANEWLLRRRESTALEALTTLVAVDQDPGLAKVGFTGVVEVSVRVGHFVEIVERFGSFRVW